MKTIIWKTREQLEDDALASNPQLVHELVKNRDCIVERAIFDWSTKLYCEYEAFCDVAFKGLSK